MAVLTNTMLQGTAAISDESDYIIEKSLRFKSASSSKLTRIATGGNTRTFTISWWQKKHTPNTLDNKNCGTFSAQTDNNNHFTIGLENSGQGNHNSKRNGNSELNVGTSTYMFRDTTAWMHYCVACNTPDRSSEGARFKIYINGKERFTSGTRFDQNDPTEWNKEGVTHTIGWSPLSNWGYPDITFADIYHIDGLALSPAAFGQWDDTNCWQPKTFALPTPNTNASSPTWSNMLTTGSAGWDGSGSANGSPTRAFTGSGAGNTSGQWAYTAANNMGESHAIVFTPTGGIEINQSLEIYCGRSATTESVVAYVDMGNGYGEKITGTSGKWITLFEGKGTLTKFKTWKTAGNGGENGLSGVRVDGVDLVDGKTDPAERSNPNDGRVYSNAANWDNTSISNSLSNLFNSDSIHDYIYGEEIIWDTSGYSDFSGLLEFNMDAGTGCTIEVNDNAITPLQGSVTSATGWWTFGYFTDINKIKVTQTGGTAPYFYGVKLNGHLLLDATNDHSFHLKFNDTSTNARLGRNSIGNVSVGDATGGLPIYNTTADSDGYDDGSVKGSGNRTDALNSSLILAMPLSDAGDTDATTWKDISADIKGSGSNKAVTRTGTSTQYSTAHSRLYGASTVFDNASSQNLNIPYSSDFDFTGDQDFCIEGWFNATSIVNSAHLFSLGTSSAFQCNINIIEHTGYPGKCFNFESPNTRVRSNAPIVAGVWYHFACVSDGGTQKMYLNGKLQDSTGTNNIGTSDTVMIGRGTHYNVNTGWKGHLQDFRIYRNKKYSANFTPPTRNDFTVTNLGAKADTQPTKQFHTVLYNGGGGDSSILGLSFKPDLVMIKCRSSGKWPPIADVVTGAGKFLHPNSNEAQGTSNHIKSFDSNGFTVTDVDTGTSNESGLTYVAWCWKAGGTATSNSDGSITTSISVNPNNTLSIIKYTGTGSNATIGHGLNKAPKMFIIKSLSDADDWYVYHYEAGANKHLWWNKYDGVQTSTSIWQNDHPSDSVIKIGTDDGVNESGDDYICYAFAEQDGLCAIGKYTGNGSNSGPTVNLGFKPAWITTKNSESDGGAPTWLMVDSVRGTDKRLWNNFAGNNGDTESTQASYTFSDTGFTITDDGSHFNGNNKEYYYLSFAQDASSGIYGDENIDSHTDSPTNSGTDTGLGGQVTGNYCVLSSATKHGGMDSLQKGNLEAYRGSAGFRSVFGTMGMHTGKWYFECYLTAIGSNSDPNCAGVGVAASSITYRCNDYFNKDAKGYVYLAKNGETSNNDAIHNSGYTAWNNTSDVVGVAFDADAGKLFFAHNNTWQGSSNPVTGANAAYTGLTDVPYLPGVMLAEGGRAIVNFGQRPFKYTAPSGYKCLCSANLDDLFTGDNKNNPSKYFDIYNYIGDGESTRTIAGVYDFAADLIWSKARDHSNNFQVYDRIRGDGKRIYLDGDNAEDTDSGTWGFVEAGTADGAIDVIDGSNASYNMNKEDDNFITWAWDAGTAASGANNDGTVNVSSGNQWVNATAGFSITKYTGDNASGGSTVGHGLSVKPEFVMVKRLDAAQEWVVGHKDLSATKNLHISQDEAENTPAGGYIDLPNSTNDVVKLVGDPGGNGNTNYSTDYIMYCWVSIPGFSSIGTYSGTNNAGTGSFVYTGFRPKFWLSKSGNTTGGWGLYDTVRDIDGNGTASKAYTLQPQTSAAEDDSSTDINIDILSNGIQPVTTWNPVNSHDGGSGYGKMVYIAFAEHPFKTSRAL